MGSWSLTPKKKQFGDVIPTQYQIPDQIPESMETPTTEESMQPMSVRDVIKNASIPANFPVELPSPIDAEAEEASRILAEGPHQVPLPESLKPKTLKQNLKNVALSMIPVFGMARGIAEDQKESYDLALYKQQQEQANAEWELNKQHAGKVFDAQLAQQKEIATRNGKINFTRMLFPNATPEMVMKAAGIEMPTSAKINFENHRVIPYGPDGKPYVGDSIPAVFNPADQTWTYRDPWSGNRVSAPVEMLANVEKVGTGSDRNRDPLSTKIEALRQNGIDPTPDQILKMAGLGPEKEGGSVTERIAQLATKDRIGATTPEEKILLQELRKAQTLNATTTFNMNNPAADPDEVSYWSRQVEVDPKNYGMIKNKRLQQAVAADLSARGVNINQIDAATRDAAKFAKSALSHIPEFKKQIIQLANAGELGTLKGTWNDFLVGTIGKGPKFAAMRNNLKLLQTAMGRVHGGARGGGSQTMLEHFGSMLHTRMDAATMLGSIGVWQEWLKGYADMAPTYSDKYGSGGAGSGGFQVGQVVKYADGKQYKITGFDEKGNPKAQEVSSGR